MKKVALAFLIFGVTIGNDLDAQGTYGRRDPIPTRIERMYVKGLNFLKTTQNDLGHWAGNRGDEPGVVGLAIMAMLAHGEDPNSGPYAKTIKRGIDYILRCQNPANGYISKPGGGHGGMYTHGFATLALTEVYGVIADDRIGPALKHAVELILSAQSRNPTGGWRYSPTDQSSDTTVAGCQLVALFGARNAGIGVPDEAFEKGLRYFDTCRAPEGGYGYTSGRGPRMTLTSIGTLVFSLAKKKDMAHYRRSYEMISADLNYEDRGYPHYLRYYISQALFHGDEEVWGRWNDRNAKFLESTQLDDGSWMGGNAGQIFATSSCLLSMALNYRFLPIYER